MTIRCNRCGCAKFFYTSSGCEKVDLPNHHGACCAKCYKPLDLSDLIQPIVSLQDPEKSYAEL
jgi:hypothetical protein